jgi:hypothetical protein
MGLDGTVRSLRPRARPQRIESVRIDAGDSQVRLLPGAVPQLSEAGTVMERSGIDWHRPLVPAIAFDET